MDILDLFGGAANPGKRVDQQSDKYKAPVELISEVQ